MKRKGFDLHQVADLMIRHLLGIADETEQEEYRRMCQETGLLWERNETDDLVESAFRTDVWASKRKELAYRRFRRYTQVGKQPVIYYWRRVVAIVILCMAIGGGMYYFSSKIAEDDLYVQEVAPAPARVYLVLSDGSRVDLSAAPQNARIYEDNIAVCDSGKLEYGHQADDWQQPGACNQIFVPRGGEYRLVLSDGTKVWVNAASELKYPVRFGGSQREVFMKGEAYFEVEKDSTCPFIVHTSRGAVQVLGTEFNVRDYEDEAKVVTTLVKGSVEYRTSRSRVVLKPGFQSEDIGREISVRRVDVEQCVGWKDGKYIFFDESLENIMRYVERTYDTEVFFINDSVKKLRFSGDLKRYDRVESLLRYLESSGDVRFNIQNRTITVYKIIR